MQNLQHNHEQLKVMILPVLDKNSALLRFSAFSTWENCRIGVLFRKNAEKEGKQEDADPCSCSVPAGNRDSEGLSERCSDKNQYTDA